jgi:hypothetical protein
MYIDSNFVFGITAETDGDGSTGKVSTNVYDAGAAVKLFSGEDLVKVCARLVLTSDADGGVRIDLLGADDAALATNPIVLGSTGNVLYDADGTAIGTGATVDLAFVVRRQTVAKQFYGLWTTLLGTNTDVAVAASQGFICLDRQTMLPGARAAVPA